MSVEEQSWAQFFAAGDNVPATMHIGVGKLNEGIHDMPKVAENRMEAEKLAEWIFGHLTVSSSRIISEVLGKYINRTRS